MLSVTLAASTTSGRALDQVAPLGEAGVGICGMSGEGGGGARVVVAVESHLRPFLEVEMLVTVLEQRRNRLGHAHG